MAKFINPYNFVPLAGTAPKRSSVLEETAEKLYTGKIEYTIETLSPLFIPNTSNDRILGVRGEDDNEDAYHKSYDFFSYHDLSEETDPDACYEPVIPGSEIRGAVRSVYEAMTNSCLSVVDEDVPLSKRTAEHFIAGILRKDGEGYKLYEARDYLYRANGREDFSLPSYRKELPADGSKVYFDKDTDSAPDRPGYAKPFADNISSKRDHRQSKEGYLIKGEAGPELKQSRGSKCDSCPEDTQKKCEKNKQKNCYLLEKHCAHVFEMKGNPVRTMKKEEAKDVSRRMDILLEIYSLNRDHKGMYNEYRRTWEKFKADDQIEGVAVYYSIAGDICYLSPACITREIYRNTVREILGTHRPCSDREKACPACRLFGAVNGEDFQIASKIRFSDAYVAEKRENRDYYEKPLTLLELSAPKLSSTEFYLRRPHERAMSWTYDYYVLLEKDNSVSVKVYTPQIAGRKFYWHSPATAEWVRSVQNKIPKNERNKTIRPLKKGVAFRGELYFDGITGEQLDELIRILNISALEEGKYALKLGSAKPLGFGSVSMQIEQVLFRTVSFDGQAGIVYRADVPYDYQTVGLTQEIRDTGILTILDTEAVVQPDAQQGEERTNGMLHYPYVKQMNQEEEEGFVWFTENRIGFRQDRHTERLDLSQTDAAPRSRKQIVYRSYMHPLMPTLQDNEIGRNVTDGRDRNDRGRTTQGGRNNQTRKYEIKKKYHGTVTGYRKERYAQIALDGGGNASVPARRGKNGAEEDIKKTLPIGTNVTVIYLGKNDAGYDRWFLEK